jgi:LysM repeat protein
MKKHLITAAMATGLILTAFGVSASADGNTYTVQSGDTLSGIANKYNTTYQELARINGISNPNLISIGQVLKINSNEEQSAPVSVSSYKTYVVKSGDSLSAIASKYGTTYQKIASDNGISNPNFISIGQVLKIY